MISMALHIARLLWTCKWLPTQHEQSEKGRGLQLELWEAAICTGQVTQE